MIYKARTEAPERDNKYYMHTSAGGVNKCLHLGDGEVLPNCVAYAWGRAYEILGTAPKLSRGNAENWYSYSDGYERGFIPKLGAVICWRKGQTFNEADGCGHVGIVESVTFEKVTVSMSAYGGTRWYTRTFDYGMYDYNGYIFQGFIYLPIIGDKYTTGCYRVTDASLLHVRMGAGTDHLKKSYSEFTKNAQSQIYELVRYKANGYVMGVEFTVYEVSGNWGRTPSGWVCLDYCTKI